jgi:hypothetical protein
MRDLNLEEPYRPQEDGFDFAFGLGTPLDPSYGTFEVTEVRYTFTDQALPNGEKQRVKEKRGLSLVECGSQYFNYANKGGIKKFGIDKMMCIKDKD